MNYKYPHLLILLLFIFLTTSVAAQKISIDTSKVNKFVSEVYMGVEADLGYDKPENIQRFKNIIERFEIVISHDDPDVFNYLSEIPVINLYNKNLSIDEPFNPHNFNPLKYKFNTTSIDDKVYYRVDNTDYIIIIHPE